jgi:DNA-binding transcriptional LysR family regulator
MEHRNLISFKKVAETGSFSKAAIELGYAQSTVTFQIKQLEEELSALLFDRIGNHISITEAGATLLDYSCRILSLENEVKNIIKEDDMPSGTIRIASIDSLCANLLPPLIRDFSELYPAVTISASSVSKAEVLNSITNGSADFGFYMDFAAPTDDFITVVSIMNSLSFLCDPSNKIYKQKAFNIKELDGISMIVTEKNCTYRNLLQQIFAQNNTKLKVYFESDNTEVIKHFVEAGIGITFLPDIAVNEELNEHKLCRLPVDVKIPSNYINVIHHKNKWLTSAMREFCNLLKTRVETTRTPGN